MSLDHLPAEILQKIFDYLPRSEQLQKTTISRRWNQLALRETYLILAYGEQLIDERILRRTMRGYCCFSIEFSDAYEPLRSRLEICARKFTPRKLILDGIQTYALVSCVNDHRQWLRSLVHLSVTVCNKVNSGDIAVQLDLPRLRILSWTYNTDDGSIVLPVVRLNAPMLEDAYVEHCDVNQTPLILENTMKLKTLGLSVPGLIGNLCPAGLGSLQCLRIYHSSKPFAWSNDQLNLSQLTVLELCGCTVTNESLAFIRHFPNLDTLVLQSDSTSTIDLRILSNSLPNLKQLRLFDVKWTSGREPLNFPYLQILDINNTLPEDQGYPLEINAPFLLTLKGTCLNLHGFQLSNYSTVRTMIIFDLYLNFLQPRLFSSVMILYMDVPCNVSQLLLTECLHQFPKLTRLTVVLHEKRAPVGLNGHLLAISFIHLSYLHLQNFDLDYNFLVGIAKSNRLSTLILQDGTVTATPDNEPLCFDELLHLFVKNVRIPKNLTVFPILYPCSHLVLSLADSNVFCSTNWDERIIKSREDYVTYLLM